MAGYSARQSSFTTGDTITAAHSNNEFNQILAAFHVSTGHTHDGSTAGDGGPLSTLFSNTISMGTGADTDVAVTFNANSNDGVITWMEDEDYFQFSDDILLSTTEKVQFRDTAIYINSSTDGQLDLVADTEIQIAATTVDINGNVDISGSLTLGGTTITSTGAELNILDGVTATATELNLLDGVTATTTELNLLDGVTATTAELNYVDGVTSNVQTQLNAKLADVVSDTSPQLGGNLDMNGQDIVTTSNANLELAPNGTGKVVVKGNDNQGAIVLNCENNSHGITIQSAPHSAGASYTVKLPDTLGLTNASAIVTSDSNGVVSFDNGTIEESTTITSSSNAATINLRDGNVFEHDLTENVTYTFSNPAASGRASAFVLKVIQDSSARTITWPGSVDWASATAPTLTTTNNGVDVFGFLTIDGGTTYYGFTLGQALG